MNNYEILKRLGGGTFADVYKAIDKKTGEYVAIKILKKKYSNWEECLELRECKSLKRLQDSSLNSYEKGIENIIKLKEMIFIKETGTLNLIFEYMEKDLFILMKERTPKKLNENQIRSIIYQTLMGLSYMHKYGFFHRDLKPENLLVTGEKIKIADFGLAREIRSIPPYTEYVSTRYYRAPECILKSTNYNSPIDIWALGCIMAEMYLHPKPLFYGNNEKEVLFRICNVLGTPNHENWNEGVSLGNKMDIKFPKCDTQKLDFVIKGASKDAIDLISQMIKWDPNKRATASNLLKHSFFNNLSYYDFSNNNLLISAIKSNNGNRYNCNLSIQTKDDIHNLKKEDESNFILNETDFDNLLNKLKNDKYDEDLELSTTVNRNLIASPINGDRDFDYESFKKNAPTFTQNTLFLGNSTVFKGDSSSIMNKNITHITEINNNKNDNSIIDYNGKKIFDASVINNINNGITMTSIIQNNSNINNSNDHILTNTSIENGENILPIDEKDFCSNNLSKIENPNDEINFENAKPLKNITNNNKRRSARQFIEDSQKVGTDYMTIPKKNKETPQIPNSNSNKNVRNKFENNDIKYKGNDFNFQSRRNKQHNNNNNENIKGKIQNKQIHLNKLLEEADKKSQNKNDNINNNNNNNNNNKGFLFGMESRRQNNKILKKVK